MLKNFFFHKIGYLGGHETTVKLGDINQGSVTVKSRIKSIKPKAFIYLKKFIESESLDDIKKYIELQYGFTSLLIKTIPKSLHTKKTKTTETKLFNKKASNYIKVLKSLKEHGYNPDKFKSGHIKMTNKNVLCDGNHRFQLLCAMHGSDYQIKVWKVGILTRCIIGLVFLFAWTWVVAVMLLMMCTHTLWFFVQIPIRILAWFWKITLGRIF